MSKRFLPALVAAGLSAFAGAAHAAPTAACLWNGLTPIQRASVAQAVADQTELTADARFASQLASERCGFEPGPAGRQRSAFLLAMDAHRARLEAMIVQRSRVTPARLDRAYARMPAAFRAELISFAAERVNNRMPPPPDETRFQALMRGLHLGDDARPVLQNYLVVRAATEYAEMQGPAFSPPPQQATAP